MKILVFLIVLVISAPAIAWENCGDPDELVADRVDWNLTHEMPDEDYNDYIAVALYEEYFEEK